METVSTSATTLQDVASVDDFLNVAATETAPLFESLEFGLGIRITEVSAGIHRFGVNRTR